MSAAVNIGSLNGRRAWGIAFLLFLAQTINYFDKTVIGLAAGPIMDELGLTSAQYGLVASSFFSLYALSGVLVGFFVAHRIKSKLLLTILVLIWSLSQLPIIFFASLTTLIVCRVLLGIGEGPATPTAVSAVHEWFTPDARNMPTAFLTLGASFGALLAGPTLSYFIIAHGWRSAFVVCSLLGLIWVVLWQIFGSSGPDAAPTAAPADKADDACAPISQKMIWSDPTIGASIVVGFTAYWVVGFSVAWVAPMVSRGLGFDQATTGWIMSAIAGTNSILLLSISFLSQTMLKRGATSRTARAVINGLCMIGGGVAFAGAALVADPVAKLALVAIGGALPTLTFVLGPSLVSGFVPASHRNRLIIMIYAGITIAGFVSPIVAGWLIGEAGITGYDDALMVNACVVVVGGVTALLFLHPERSAARFAAAQ